MLSDAVQRCFWQRACGRCHGIGTHRSRDGSLADGLGVFEALLAAFGRCPLWCAFPDSSRTSREVRKAPTCDIRAGLNANEAARPDVNLSSCATVGLRR